MCLHPNPLLAWHLRHGEQLSGQELCFGGFYTIIAKNEDTCMNDSYKLLLSWYAQGFVEMDRDITVKFDSDRIPG